MFDAVDLAILVLVLLGMVGGYRRGLVPSVTQYAGLFLGVLVAAAVSTPALDRLGIYDPNSRPLSAGLMLVLGACLGAAIGFWVGEPLRRRVAGTTPPHLPERAAGALTSVLAVLLIVWSVGIAFAQSTDSEVSSMVQGSTVLRGIDSVAPEPPGFLGPVERTVAAVPFPSTFFPGRTAGLPDPLSVPSTAPTAGVQATARNVYRVEGSGCGGLVTGSAFPVAPDYVVTNAHVVAGTSDTRVMQDDGGINLEATVVYFDGKVDVAVLHVPGLNATVPADATAERGTTAWVVGYPGGGAQTVTTAAIDGQTAARFEDIYNNQEVTRQVWVFNGTVRRGNSGGPLLTADGRVIGVVFAASSRSTSTQAYALTDQQIQQDVSAGVDQGATVDTGAMACAV